MSKLKEYLVNGRFDMTCEGWVRVVALSKENAKAKAESMEWSEAVWDDTHVDGFFAESVEKT